MCQQDEGAQPLVDTKIIEQRFEYGIDDMSK